MSHVDQEFLVGEPDELGQVVRTDATGNVDISLVEYCLSLTPAQRVEQNYQARRFTERLRDAGGVTAHGPFASDSSAAE